jgi:hypothetical protein
MLKKKRSEAALLVLHPQTSVWMRWALFWVHALACVALWLAALPWWLATLGCGGLLLSAWLGWRKPLAVCCLQWGRDELWQLELVQGGWVEARLDVQGCRFLPWWVFLDFRLDDGQHLGVTLAADSLTTEEFRRLRARMQVELGAS